jgi:hypothetical protein
MRGTTMSARSTNLSLLAALCVGGTAFGATVRVCDLATKHAGLVPYRVQADTDDGGKRTIKADVDQDGSDDVLQWFDGGSASNIPADESTFTLTLTSNHQSFTLQQQRLYVVEVESRYYVVTTRAETQLGPWYREVFGLARAGITRVCSFEGKGQVP